MSFSKEDDKLLTDLVHQYYLTRPGKRESIIEDRVFYKYLTKQGIVRQFPLQHMFRVAAVEKLKEDPSKIREIAEKLDVSEVSLYTYLKKDIGRKKTDKDTYYYAIARYVNKETAEFCNIGVIVVSGSETKIVSRFADSIERLITFFDAGSDRALIKTELKAIEEEIQRYFKMDDTIGESGYKYLCNLVYHIKKHPMINSKSYTFNKIYKYTFVNHTDIEEFKESLYKKYIKE